MQQTWVDRYLIGIVPAFGVVAGVAVAVLRARAGTVAAVALAVMLASVRCARPRASRIRP